MRAVVLGLTLVGTALACGYYGVFAGLSVGLASLFYLVARRHWKQRRVLPALACAAAVAILAIWPFYDRYLGLHSQSQPFRALEEARGYSANWAAYLAADGFGNGWVKMAALKASGVRWQEVLFPGLATLILAAFGVAAAFAARPHAATGQRARPHARDRGVLRPRGRPRRPGCRLAPTRGSTP